MSYIDSKLDRQDVMFIATCIINTCALGVLTYLEEYNVVVIFVWCTSTAVIHVCVYNEHVHVRVYMHWVVSI